MLVPAVNPSLESRLTDQNLGLSRVPGIINIVVTKYKQNARIVYCPVTREGMVIDPGANPKEILTQAMTNNIDLKCIWLTHSHPDHCGAVGSIVKERNIPLFASDHIVERAFRAVVMGFAKRVGMDMSEVSRCPSPSYSFSDGETVLIGTLKFKAVHTPGHSPGHMALHDEHNGIFISGDTVFKDSIATPYIPGASLKTLRDTIERTILSLPDDTLVLSGHGENTTIGYIREHNPLVKKLRSGELRSWWNRAFGHHRRRQTQSKLGDEPQ